MGLLCLCLMCGLFMLDFAGSYVVLSVLPGVLCCFTFVLRGVIEVWLRVG